MDEAANIRTQIEKIPSLELVSPYSADYQLWDKATENLVRGVFGDDGVKLFKQQESVVIPRDNEKWKKQYVGDLQKKKRILEGLLANKSLYSKRRAISHNGRVSAVGNDSLPQKLMWNIIVPLAVLIIGGLILFKFFGIG